MCGDIFGGRNDRVAELYAVYCFGQCKHSNLFEKLLFHLFNVDDYSFHLYSGGVLHNIGDLVDYAFGNGCYVKTVNHAYVKVDNNGLTVSLTLMPVSAKRRFTAFERHHFMPLGIMLVTP